MFKIETHLHTNLSSSCGQLSPEQIVDGYLQAGYHGLILTDHYNRDTFRFLGLDTKMPGDHLAAFLTGYRKLAAIAEKQGLKVYRGAEVRFDGSWNDYLLYGYSDALLRDPEAVFTMGVERFYELVKADGALLIHAHPYRNGGQPTTAQALDGVEVVNTNHHHDNRNDLALRFARVHGLLETCGSDCHEWAHVGRGGILAEQLPENDRELVVLLRSRNYKLIGE
jgi:histidinol phosphatase-like PHP family hydrolase